MVDSPSLLKNISTLDQKKVKEKWDRSKHMSVMIMKNVILKLFMGTISKTITTTKEFLKNIKSMFVKNKNAEIGTLLISLILMMYRGKGNIKDYIMEMSHFASKLKAFKLKLSEGLLVRLVLLFLLT